ncbi:dihydropteroate synthase [Candidatus Blochmanniella vafra str. BVAF]|uniref:Dihydropteroate synthase n=1 Tax=Blochmanniella vafra (strain BVAF) TaxID=859654 RepID=E8Q6R7_BLOVB|nr:dihydropteroate synthase [Candidatus Blochmannia vafer]ADV33508.1 dihydropteroate synthase [Candidatus Blochmannia vafer str. BVAF]
MKLVANERVLDLSYTQIMGILNVTPDSFFDGGLYNTVPKSIDHVDKMISNGATLIDIGGESTRPGSKRISDEEELERVLPVIQAIVNRFDIFISVNTSSALVIKESAQLGVHLINDVRSLADVEAMKAAKYSNLPICLMHMQGSPDTMQKLPSYHNVVHEVFDYFKDQITRCQLAGINKTRLLLDPGFGFGKSFQHNYQLLSNLKYFHHFNLPLLIGISRKSMLHCNNNTYCVKNRLAGSIACAVIASIQKVQIIRVHDVKETMEALRIVKIVQEERL